MNFIIKSTNSNISDLFNIGNNYIKFDNGSIIYVILNDYPFLGLRVNELIYDDNIAENIIKTIYEPMYIPYIYSKEYTK